MSVHPRRPLPTSATRLVHSSLLARTSDYEDHTFSGIIFILQVNSLLPIDFVEIHSVFVRGQMGQMSVYSTQDQVENSQIDTLLGESLGKPEKWQTHFGPYEIQNRYPALNVELELDVPIRICNGCSVAIYVHSETAGDMAIVYDQQRRVCGYKDDIIRILPGISHTSNIPHSNINHWGRMAWRGGRSFVGQIKYGAKHLLWTPPSQSMFSQQFNRGVFHLLLCQHRLGPSQFGALPLDCLWIIINFLPHDAFDREDIGKLLETQELLLSSSSVLPIAATLAGSYLLAYIMSVWG